MTDENLHAFLKKIQKFKNLISLFIHKNGCIIKSFTYQDVCHNSIYLKNILIKVGVEAKNQIVICIDSIPEIIPIILGILEVKCSFCPLVFKENSGFDGNLFINNLKELQSKYVILPKLFINNNLTFLSKLKIFESNFYLYQLKTFSTNSFLKTSAQFCYSIRTSGTTGKSKIVKVPWNCIWPNIQSLSEIYEIETDDIILPTAPPIFDPFILDIFLALNNGASLLFTNEIVQDLCKHYKHIFNSDKNAIFSGVTIMQITPSVFQILKNEVMEYIIKDSSLRILTFGGEPFQHVKFLNTHFGVNKSLTDKRIFNIYGITEISCWASIYEIDVTKIRSEIPLGKSIDSSIILDVRDCNDLTKTKESTLCELYIGSKIRKCLLDNEKDTEIYDTDKLIFRNSGDLIEKIDGELFYRGRINSTIKRFGCRVILSYIENIFLQQSETINCAAVFSEMTNELLLFLVVIDSSCFEYECCLDHLKPIEKPNKIIFVNEFPVNKNGKMDKQILLENYYKNMYSNVKVSITTAKLSISEIMIKFISNIFKIPVECLRNLSNYDQHIAKKQKTVLNSSFLSQGGTSIDILNLISELEITHGNKIISKIMEMLFDNDCSISRILNYIEENNIDTATSLEDKTTSKILTEKMNYLELIVKWKFDTGKCVDACPSLHKNFVIVGSHSHLLVNLDSDNGKVISTLNLPDRIESQVATLDEVNGEFGYVGCYDGFLYKFNLLNGHIVNKFNSEGMIKCKALLVNEFVIFGNYSNNKNVFCLHKKDLTLRWSSKVGLKGIVSSPIQLTKFSILICTLDGTCSCLNYNSGEQIWINHYSTPIFSTSVIIPDLFAVLLSEVKGTLHLIDLNGNELSSFQADGNVFSSFEIKKKNNQLFVFFGCYDFCLYCIRLEKNYIDFIWKCKFQSSIYSTPKLVEIKKSIIACCSSIGIVSILDIKTGKPLQSLKLPGEIFSTPVYKNGSLYIGCRDNYLYCIQIKINDLHI